MMLALRHKLLKLSNQIFPMPSMHASLPPKPVADTAAALVWLASADAAAAYGVHTAAIAGVPAGMVRPDPLSHFQQHVERDGCLLGCIDATGTMVGYGVLGIDSPMACHLAQLLGADPARFAVLDGAAALPQWRGYGLHQQAIDQRIACASARGRSSIGATVSPNNLRALRSLFHSGFRIEGFARLYGAMERLLVLRDTRAPVPQDRIAIWIDATDSGAHQAALASGLAGLALRQDADARWRVGYGPLA
jgi:hypothetical protein